MDLSIGILIKKKGINNKSYKYENSKGDICH